MNKVLEILREEIGKIEISQTKPLKSLFNELNGNSKNCIYPFARISGNGELIKPVTELSNDSPDRRSEICSPIQSVFSSY